VDDVTVANAAACRDNPLFSDSFENGNLVAWTGPGAHSGIAGRQRVVYTHHSFRKHEALFPGGVQ